jgi:TatD DNase family protein
MQVTRPALPAEPTLSYVLHGNLYLNITWHCTLRCAFCPKFNGDWEVQGYDLRLRREPTVEELIAAIGDPTPYQEIVFCGLGEPTLRLDVLLQVAAAMKALGKRVRVNTDGLANLVYGRDVTPEMAPVVDAVSISLTAQDEATYVRHTRPKRAGAYAAVRDFALRAKQAGMAVTLTAIDGLDGVDIPACERIAQDLGVNFRRRMLDAVG